MPQDVGALVWTVGGGVIVILLGVVSFYTVNWMRHHDIKSEDISKLVAAHDKEIAVIATNQKSLFGRLEELIGTLNKHIDSEEIFWRENSEAHTELLERLSNMEGRHMDDVKKKPPVRRGKKSRETV